VLSHLSSVCEGTAFGFDGYRVQNEFNLAFNSSLSLTVAGPGGYYHYDFQPIVLTADEVKDYSFSWAVPQAAGTYVAEVGLVPAQLAAYDAVWLRVS
jgi:hypothetical protein